MTAPGQEPSSWELKRLIERLELGVNGLGTRLEARLDKLVSQEAFAAEQRRVDDKMKDLSDDISQERLARAAEIAREESERTKGDAMQQGALDKLGERYRWVVVAIVLPIVLFIANALLQYGSGLS